MSLQVREYATTVGRRPFGDWFAALGDALGKRAVAARIARLQAGLRGEDRRRRGVRARVQTGPGYRVYCAQDGNALVLLLCAGDKPSQTKDIRRAHDYWKDYLARR
jgi:putative addiction module killer protein